MSFFENTRRPEGFGGKLMVSMMNLGHAALAEWGLQHLAVPEGGLNISLPRYILLISFF